MSGDRFEPAVRALDAGDTAALARLLAADPTLVRDRIEKPAPWLREEAGAALDGFFARPWLLWFVAGDPPRPGSVPANAVEVARLVIDAARNESVPTLAQQLDYTARLVCWSARARERGVQVPLLDLLLDAGASPDGVQVYGGRYGSHSDSAIYSGSPAAAARLVERGARLTLTTAAGLGRWGDLDRLFDSAGPAERADTFVQAALNGNAEALRRLLARGMSATLRSGRTQSHGTALHHAVWSGSLESVRLLVEAGAELTSRDTIYEATPLGWARYGAGQAADPVRRRAYEAIAKYLQECGAPE